jgi:hypothetical protein
MRGRKEGRGERGRKEYEVEKRSRKEAINSPTYTIVYRAPTRLESN